MGRSIRNTLVLAKAETTEGTDAAPTAAADAVLVTNVRANVLNAQNVDRDLIRGYFGGSEQLVGTAYKTLDFDVELAGSGTAGTAPRWGQLLLGCGMTENVLASPARVEYLPASTNLKSLTLYYYDDGALHKLLGARGNVKLSAKVGERPMLSFSFIGIDGGDTAVTQPTGTLTAWKTPPVIAKPNVIDVVLGGVYATGAVTGGTGYNSQGLEDVDWGNEVAYTPLLSSESIDLTDRKVGAKVKFDLTAAQEIALLDQVRTNATQSLAFQIGKTAGNKILVFAPAAQLYEPTKEEVNKRRLIGYSVRLVPSAGNDEIRLVSL